MHIHALSRKERCVHIRKLSFGPWYLVHGILVLVRGICVDPRYCFYMVLYHGIEKSLNLYKEKIIRQNDVQGMDV